MADINKLIPLVPITSSHNLGMFASILDNKTEKQLTYPTINVMIL